MKKKIMTVFGTRPEAIKMAPVVKGLENDLDLEPLVVVTAQHREMLDQVLDQFAIQPDYDLNIMKDRQTLSGVLSRALLGLEEVIQKEQPDLILVHGDTATTFAGALAAFYQQIPVGHVEAGLRTGDKFQPFPEEINRHLTGVVTDLHFAPSVQTKENLLQENISEEKIYVTGNTVIDALFMILQKEYQGNDARLQQILNSEQRIILITAHRRENLGEPLAAICQAILEIRDQNPDVELVYPVHLNPAVRETVYSYLEGQERIHLLEPLDYLPFSHLMQKADLVMTDSGGLQEEAPALGKPVLVMREKTERQEAVTAGTVQLVGTDREKIVRIANLLLQDPSAYQKMAQARNPYGDGTAVAQIIKAIKNYLE